MWRKVLEGSKSSAKSERVAVGRAGYSRTSGCSRQIGALVCDAESGLNGFPARIDRQHLRDRLRGKGGADLFVSDQKMAGVDRHMKQPGNRRNIVMNLSLWGYSGLLMISRR